MNYYNRGGICIQQWPKSILNSGKRYSLISLTKNHTPRKLKVQAVESYFKGNGSIDDVCIKYEITSNAILRRWIKKYNSNRELKDYGPKREVYMAEVRRKTSIEERKKIVESCITHNRDYKDTASRGFQYTSKVFQKYT